MSASVHRVAKNHATEATEHACTMRSRIMVCRKGGNIFFHLMAWGIYCGFAHGFTKSKSASLNNVSIGFQAIINTVAS